MFLEYIAGCLDTDYPSNQVRQGIHICHIGCQFRMPAESLLIHNANQELPNSEGEPKVANSECLMKVANSECQPRVANSICQPEVANWECLPKVANSEYLPKCANPECQSRAVQSCIVGLVYQRKYLLWLFPVTFLMLTKELKHKQNSFLESQGMFWSLPRRFLSPGPTPSVSGSQHFNILHLGPQGHIRSVHWECIHTPSDSLAT